MLLTLVVPVTIIYTYFYWQEQILEQTVEQRLKANTGHENLVILKFSLQDAAALRWEHDHEFEYRGIMYDVVDRHTISDSVYYRCWPDHEESRFRKDLCRTLAIDFGENPARKKQESRIFSFLKSMINSVPCEVKCRLEDLSDSTVSGEKQPNCETRSIRPPTPPPQCA